MVNAKYVFASNSTRTVVNATRWYREGGRRSFAPIVHFQSITNAAWFLRPANASNVPMHEPVAVCAAMLQPSAGVWSRFVGYLDDFVKSGELTDDESIVILASGLTHIKPQELESETDMEATTVREIIERVREEQQAGFLVRLEDKQKQIADSNRAVLVARKEATLIRSSVQTQATKLATLAATVIYAALCIILRGAFLTLPIESSD